MDKIKDPHACPKCFSHSNSRKWLSADQSGTGKDQIELSCIECTYKWLVDVADYVPPP